MNKRINRPKATKPTKNINKDNQLVNNITNRVLSNVQRGLTTRKMDTTVYGYLSTVCDPFHPSSLSRGIYSGAYHKATAVVRRRSVHSVTLNANTGGVNSGVDICIPLAGAYAPSIYTATNAAADWSGATTIVEFGRNTTPSIPAGCSARVVAAGLKITCLDPPDVSGGRFNLFYSGDSPGIADKPQSGAASVYFGSTQTALTERLATGTVVSGETIMFVVPPEINFYDATTSVAAPSSWAADQTGSGAQIRLFYDASTAVSGKFEFEVCSVVEYYADEHKDFARPVVNHTAGEAVHNAVGAILASSGSENANLATHGGSGGLFAKVASALGYVEKGAMSAMRTVGAVYNGMQGVKMIKDVYTGMTTAAEMAVVLA